jgi:hypothetical protein
MATQSQSLAQDQPLAIRLAGVIEPPVAPRGLR